MANFNAIYLIWFVYRPFSKMDTELKRQFPSPLALTAFKGESVCLSRGMSRGIKALENSSTSIVLPPWDELISGVPRGWPVPGLCLLDRSQFLLSAMICGYPQGLHHLHELNPPKNMDVAPASMFALHSNISFPFCYLWEPILWYYPAHLFQDIGTSPYGLKRYWKAEVLPYWSTKYMWGT